MTPLLAGRGISHTYGPRRVLLDVDCEVHAGETLAIVGNSGAGKSTLFSILALLMTPSAGQVLVDGQVCSVGASRSLRRSLQVVLQGAGASLAPRWTVGRSLQEAWTVFGESVDDERLLALLNRVGLTPDQLERRPDELSGGQRQRVAIARAIAREPRVLLLDEPFAGLDVSIAAQIHGVLESLRQDGLTMVVVSHDLAMVRRLADRVAVMAEGRIVEVQPVAKLFDSPRTDATRALLDAMPRLDGSSPLR